MSLHDPRAHHQRGQASVEWLAVVALVAVMLGLGAALAQAGYRGSAGHARDGAGDLPGRER